VSSKKVVELFKKVEELSKKVVVLSKIAEVLSSSYLLRHPTINCPCVKGRNLLRSWNVLFLGLSRYLHSTVQE